MLTANEQAEFQAALENVQRAALDKLRSLPHKSDAIPFVSSLQRSVDQIVQSANTPGQKLDCTAGCSHCCNVRVEALAPEVFIIARVLKQLPPETVAAITERLRAHAAAVKGVSVSDHRRPCPFLEENFCTIYPVRPSVCRKMHSFNVEKCKTPGADIPQSLEILLKAEAFIQGSAGAYSLFNLPASAYELGQAVLCALSDDTAEARWLGGDAVFDEMLLRLN
jgi:Fe-S-cluster containining protein